MRNYVISHSSKAISQLLIHVKMFFTCQNDVSILYKLIPLIPIAKDDASILFLFFLAFYLSLFYPFTAPPVMPST